MPSIGDVTRPAFAYDQATDTWVPVGIGPHSHTASGVGAVATSSFAAKGDLLVGTGAGTLVAQTVGANGTVLTADSAEADGVKWATPASGGKTVIASGSLSGSVTSLTSIPGTYKDLELRILNYGAAAGGSNLQLRFNGDSNANRHSNFNVGVASTTDARARAFDNTNCPIGMSQNNATFQGVSTVVIPNYANATTWKIGFAYYVTNNATATLMNSGFYVLAYNQTGAVTSLDLLCDSSTFTNGTYILYGVS